MIERIVSALAGLKTRLMIWAGIALALLALLARVFYAGKKSARDEIAAKNAAAVKEAKNVADEVHSLDRAAVDERLARWLRDGKR